jgi:hypothetical protein
MAFTSSLIGHMFDPTGKSGVVTSIWDSAKCLYSSQDYKPKRDESTSLLQPTTDYMFREQLTPLEDPHEAATVKVKNPKGKINLRNLGSNHNY